MDDKTLVEADWQKAVAETNRLQRELDITNADHIALWIEANTIPDEPMSQCASWLACRIVEAHEKAQATRIEALEAELAKAKVPQWFYHPDYTEVCEFSPWDVIDGRYDPEPGNHVFEIECARPLPSIWCAVRVTADPDADERFTFTEHSSEAEAHKALEGTGND